MDLAELRCGRELAAHAAASRATLVRAFRATCGIAPLAFLTGLRLGLARRRLETTADAIAQIAADVGYHSEAALSRAFSASLRGQAPQRSPCRITVRTCAQVNADGGGGANRSSVAFCAAKGLATEPMGRQ